MNVSFLILNNYSTLNRNKRIPFDALGFDFGKGEQKYKK